MLKADFHIHTRYSSCSSMRPEVLVRTAASKGYDVIGVVDHNSIKGGLLAKKIAGKKMLVIPGEEIKTDKGEVVVLLSDGKYGREIVEICERAKDMNHFVFAPHPFDFLRYRIALKNGLETVKNRLDAIEVFNSRVLVNRFNSMADRYARKNRIPRMAGSDAHFPEEIGNVTNYLKCERNTDSVFNFLSKNKLRFVGRRTSIFSHVKSAIVKRL